MTHIEPRRLKGFRDILPFEANQKNFLISTLVSYAQKCGFQLIETPTLEYLETLTGQGGDETEKQIYKFKDHGERDVALRFDLTVPFARYVAQNLNELIFPLKKIQFGQVFRGENTQKGRYREFTQCDVDIIGTKSYLADIEIIHFIASSLKQLNIHDFMIRLGHREILSSLIQKHFAVTAKSQEENKILILLDKIDKIGMDKVSELLQQLNSNWNSSIVQSFFGELKNENTIKNHPHFFDTVKILKDAFGDKNIHADLSIARGLGYYTGIVFETFLTSHPDMGSIASGGRYDHLAERFTKRELPGVGGSFGIDRLLAALISEDKSSHTLKSHSQIAIISLGEDSHAYACSILNSIRNWNIPCELISAEGKPGHLFKHADRIGVENIIIVGQDENKNQTFSLKNMKKAEQKSNIAIADLEQTVRSLI